MDTRSEFPAIGKTAGDTHTPFEFVEVLSLKVDQHTCK